jgi:uncharacterized protein YmfQ (DUF2313 family)
VGLTAAAYVRSLKQLLPRGAVWLLETGSVISNALAGAADELVRVDDRGDDLIEESDPRTATETIAEWEEMLGLPDEFVTAISADIAIRRTAVAQKYASRGGQDNAFFVQLALLCGYTATFSNYYAELSVSGVLEAGDELMGLTAAYSMLVTVTVEAVSALDRADFERVIRHATHAHIGHIEFVYPP